MPLFIHVLNSDFLCSLGPATCSAVYHFISNLAASVNNLLRCNQTTTSHCYKRRLTLAKRRYFPDQYKQYAHSDHTLHHFGHAYSYIHIHFFDWNHFTFLKKTVNTIVKICFGLTDLKLVLHSAITLITRWLIQWVKSKSNGKFRFYISHV